MTLLRCRAVTTMPAKPGTQPESSGSPQLHILARQPVAGCCKTRLETHCSAEQAATIAAVLLQETVAIACSGWSGGVFLHGSPDCHHPLFASLAAQYSLSLADQQGKDLGQIQANALAVSLNIGHAAAVIGCDLPGLEKQLLQEAYNRLQQGEALLGLSPDGGYYLLGVPHLPPGLLQHIHWSSTEVSSQLLRNARACHLNIACDLPLINDVDTWQDLQAAVAAKPGLGQQLHACLPALW